MTLGPCSTWATSDDLCSPCSDYVGDMDTYLVQASELLYYLSGQQFSGACEETIHPCSQVYGGHPTQFEPFMSAPLRGLHPEQPFPWTGCGHDSACNCPGFPAIKLPRGNIQFVSEVVLDGVSYTEYDGLFELQGGLLIRIDGDRWPTCDETFTVTYTHGIDPPAIGVKAAGILACELFLACEPDAIEGAKCRLPKNVSAISRQGVSVLFERLTRTGGPFRFGIWEVDVFLEAYNPYGTKAPSVILSPDTMNLARRIP